MRLNTLHNLYYFARLMRGIRAAIADGSFADFRAAFHARRVPHVEACVSGEREDRSEEVRL